MKYLLRQHRSRPPKSPLSKLVLGGDVGGTHTNLALAWVGDGRVLLDTSFRFQTQSLDDLSLPLLKVAAYAKKRYGMALERAALGAAGPLQGRIVQLTNADLRIDPSSLKRKTGLRHLLLINDFAAIGYGINCLKPADFLNIPPKSPKIRDYRTATRAVIGAGTGLGKGILIYDEHLDLHIPYPSEGGHSDFPATLPWERELVDFIKGQDRERRAISYEDLLSGQGLGRIYQFLRHSRPAPDTPLSRRIARAKDKAPLISQHLDQDDTCREAFRLFLQLYAKCARNFALDTLALGGVYLAGGILARNILHIQAEPFRDHFEENDRHREILRRIPIQVVANYDVSLYGAALAASLPERKGGGNEEGLS
jgi:glucokinase